MGGEDPRNLPKASNTVKLRIEAATDGVQPIEDFESKTLEFSVANGEVCDAIECVVTTMWKNEKAVIKVSKADHWVDEKLGLKNTAADRIEFTLKLEEFRDILKWRMTDDENLEFASARKDLGNSLLKAG